MTIVVRWRLLLALLLIAAQPVRAWSPASGGANLLRPGFWEDFPSADAQADTARVMAMIEGLVRRAPAQYLWVHKRFKTRPPDAPAIY